MKPLLYVWRVLLTGIHLMRTGMVNANLVELNEGAHVAFDENPTNYAGVGSYYFFTEITA